MTIGVIVVLGILTFFFGSRPLITILVAGLVGWLLCDINVEKVYAWYSGIWHGVFFVPNFIRHLVWDTPYKAEVYTTGYNVGYWILSILSTIGYVFCGRRPNRE